MVVSYLAESAKDKDMNLKAEVLKGQLEHLLIFIRKSLKEDPTILQTAARDVSFTLAQIYIGRSKLEKCLLAWLEIFVLCPFSGNTPF